MADIVGGLTQAAPQARPPLQSNTDAVQAESIEKSQEAAPNIATRALEERRQQSKLLNLQIEMLKANLDARMNPPFDPTLMKTAAGFLKPTKTGSFGESLGYAAEGASDEAEKQIARNAITDKMRMELMEKQQDISQQNLISEYRAGRLGIGSAGAPRNAPPAGVNPLAGGAPPPAGVIPRASGFQAGQFPPKVPEPAGSDSGAMGPVTARDIEEAHLLDPAGKFGLVKNLVEQAKLQNDDIIMIDGKPYSKSKERFLEGSPDTMVEYDFGQRIGNKKVPMWQVKQFEAIKNEAMATNKPELVYEYFVKQDWLKPPQIDASGKPYYPTVDETAIKNAAERAAQEALAKDRATAAEARGNSLLSLGQNAQYMEQLATDVLSLTESNTKAFNLMQNATVRDALFRAIEQGASVTVGPMTVAFNLPARIALQGNKEYALTQKDIEALQLFQQKQSAITAEMRKMARSPGEGATDKTEGQLYAAIGLLPSDSARVLALKSEAMIQYARYNARAASLWAKFQEENPSKSFTSFQTNNSDFKDLQKNYVRTLNEMREKNADMLRTSPKKGSAAPSSAPATPLPSSDQSVPPGYVKDPKTGVIRKKREGD